MAVPGIRAEVERIRPIVRKMSDTQLVALSVVLREETRRRNPERVGIGNRAEE